MKFFIFTCLLAVALAKHNMERLSPSEESVKISHEKFKQQKNVVIPPNKESIYSTSCEETTRNINEMESVAASTEKERKVAEEKHHLKQLNKINQIYQKWNFLRHLQALRQPQIFVNPLGQVKTSAFPFIPIVNREQLFTSEEIPKKTVDMEWSEVVAEKNELNEEEKNYLKLLYYQKFTLPQYLKIVRQQTTMNPWSYIKTNAYQVIPFLKYF
ncbi:PREDICTED: alpha-S2-casein-like [Ceratotherium simum simum]|uniref:Alpha-S2-casein-like n=1 Tax=Ceratotherium simum simum TaxID=73337 RepID=A0ABM0H4C2_CERSS|nr:PREDICTED: alpha-S2-casein-like [Ceratotherium simum simum]